MGKTPVTLGSNVPPWPMVSIFRILLVHAATSWLVGPAGLSRFMVPNWRYCLAGRSLGLQPYFGLVVSSALVSNSRLISQGGVVRGKVFSPV
jgi:hypothetical protein